MSNQLQAAPKASFKNTLSTTDAWFKSWLDAFGQSNTWIWKPRYQQTDVAVPYRLSTQTILGLRIKIAEAAANSHTPRFDVLGESLELIALWEMMKQLGVCMMVFPYLSPQSRLLEAFQGQSNQLLYSSHPCETAMYVSTDGFWDEYWAGRGQSRREWARRERRLMEGPSTQFKCLTKWEEIEPEFNSILAIEASGWKGKQKSAIVQNESALRFYTSLAKQWSQQGYLRLFVLYQGDKPIAFELDAEFNGILHCFKHGYLEEFSKRGPGQVLRMQVLRWAFDNPDIKVFDMFGPETQAKRKWATNTEDLFTLRIYSRSLLGRLAWVRYFLGPKLKAALAGSDHK